MSSSFGPALDPDRGWPRHTPAAILPRHANPILLLGASGYVGQRFAAHLQQRGWAWKAITRQDLADWGQQAGSGHWDLLPLLEHWTPCLVINCAGVTGKPTVDWCESSLEAQRITWAGNVTLPKRVAEACRVAGVPIGHVSSGCVYQGDGPDSPNYWAVTRGWRESDTPSAEISYYARTKLAGEAMLATSGADHWIWRLRVPFDHRDGARNYLSKLQRYPKLVEVRNSLSQLDHFVWAALECWSLQVPWGCYHLTNTGSVTTSEVVDLIKAQRGLQLPSWEPDWYTSVAQFQREVVAVRSACVLNTDKLAGVGIRLPPVREAIQDALRRWVLEIRR